MAEDNIDLNSSGAKIPLIHKGKEVSVGFNDLGSIQPFDELFGKYFTKNQGQTFSKNLNEISKNINKFISLTDITENERKKQIEKLVSAMNNVKEAIDESSSQEANGSKFEKIKPTLIKVAKEIGKAITQSVENNFKRLEYLRDIESAGVTITQGFDSLRQASVDLVRPQEQLAKLYTKNSQTLQKLTASYGDGVTFFNQSLQSISGKFNLTRQEEENILSSYMETRVKYSNLEQIEQKNMRSEMVKYTQDLKLLSKATGKSIDLILEETKLKEDNLAYNAIIANNKSAQTLQQSLSAVGLSDSMVQALITGDVSNERYLGLISTPEGKMLADLVQNAMKDKNFSAEKFRDEYNKIYDATADTRQQRQDELVNNTSAQWAIYNQSEFLSSTLLPTMMRRMNETTNKQDDETLTAARNFDDELTKSTLMYENLITQSTQTFTKELDIATSGLKMFNENILEPIHKWKLDLKDNAIADSLATMGVAVGQGVVSGLAQSLGSALTSSGSSRFGSLVDKLGSNKGSGGESKSSFLSSLVDGSGGLDKVSKLYKFVQMVRIAGVLVNAGFSIKDFYEGDKLSGTKNLIKAGLWGLDPRLGASGEVLNLAGGWIGDYVGENMETPYSEYTSEKHLQKIKDRYQQMYNDNDNGNGNSPAMVTPIPPSYSYQTQNEYQTIVQTIPGQEKSYQKDIKEINQLMLDSLQRIEREQNKMNLQLENIGYYNRENNTGAV